MEGLGVLIRRKALSSNPSAARKKKEEEATWGSYLCRAFTVFTF
jgi:hypothetical protein